MPLYIPVRKVGACCACGETQQTGCTHVLTTPPCMPHTGMNHLCVFERYRSTSLASQSSSTGFCSQHLWCISYQSSKLHRTTLCACILWFSTAQILFSLFVLPLRYCSEGHPTVSTIGVFWTGIRINHVLLLGYVPKTNSTQTLHVYVHHCCTPLWTPWHSNTTPYVTQYWFIGEHRHCVLHFVTRPDLAATGKGDVACWTPHKLSAWRNPSFHPSLHPQKLKKSNVLFTCKTNNTKIAK